MHAHVATPATRAPLPRPLLGQSAAGYQQASSVYSFYPSLLCCAVRTRVHACPAGGINRQYTATCAPLGTAVRTRHWPLPAATAAPLAQLPVTPAA